MSLAIGDHLVIKRGDKILGPGDEAYHEYEVVGGCPDGIQYSYAADSKHEPKSKVIVKLEVVK